MQLTRPFHSPRTALAWHFVRYHQISLILVFLAVTLFGLILGADATPDSPNTTSFFLLMMIMLPTMFSDLSERSASFQLLHRLPVSTTMLHRNEALCFSGCLTLAGIIFWSTFHLTAPSSVDLGVAPIVLLAASGLYVQAWCWALRARNKLFIALTMLAMLLVLTPGVFVYVLMSDVNLPGPIQTMGIFVVGAFCAYLVSFRLAHRVRTGTGSKAMLIKAPAIDEARPGENTSPVAAFPSTASAQVWFEFQNSRRPGSSFTHTGMVYGLLLLTIPSAFYDVSSVGFRLADLGLLFGVTLLAIRTDGGRNWLDYQLPLSDWTLSVYFLRFALGCLILVTLGVGIGAQSWSILTGGDTYAGLTTLLLMLWAGWSGLGMGMAFVLLLFPWMYMEEASWPALEFAAVCVFGIFLTAAILLATYPNQRRYTPGVCLALAAALAVVAGNFALLYAATGPAPNALSREVLGTILVLAFTYHHVELGRIPARAGWKLAGLLLFSAMAACAFHALAPPDKTTPSIAAVLFTLGVVPPVFLPFLIQPQFMAWQRFSIEFQKNWKRSAQWLK